MGLGLGLGLGHDLQRGSVDGSPLSVCLCLSRGRVCVSTRLCGLDQRQGGRVALWVDAILGRVRGGVDLGTDGEVAVVAHRGEHGLEHLGLGLGLGLGLESGSGLGF